MSHYIRSCPHCGWFFVDHRIICKHCEFQLLGRLEWVSNPLSKELYSTALWRWRPQRDDLLSRFLMAGKGVEERGPWIPYAAAFLEADRLHPESVLVPVPSLRKSNHALGIAKAISYLSGVPIREYLGVHAHSEAAKQQHLSKGQREKAVDGRFYVKNSEVELSNKDLILIDDVITTGTTARALAANLTLNNSVKIWALASRSLAIDESV